MEKDIHKIIDPNNDKIYYVSLSQEQVKFLKWLIANGFFYDDPDFCPSEIPKVETI